MITVKDLHLSLGKREILKNLSFELNQHDWLAIVGPNGAGKTSLLKCLLRIHPIATGTILFEGRDISLLSYLEKAKIFSYVPQLNIELDPHYKIWDLLEFSRYSYSSQFSGLEDAAIEKANNLIKEYDLEKCLQTPLVNLSGGERQRAMLVAALFQEAKVILLDEPTSFLDPAYQDDLIGKLRMLKNTGKQIIFVTHDLNLAKSLSDRILGINNGSVQFFAKTEDVSLSTLNTLFDKEFTTVQIGDREHIVPVNY